MRGTAVALASVLALAAGFAPAQAVPGRDLYMVKNLEDTYGIYSGQYIALRKKGPRVVGAFGVIGSVYMCGKGRVENGRFRAVARRGKEEPYNFRGKWVGSGGQQHIKGWKSVTRGQLTSYMSSDPDRPAGVPIDPYPVLKECAAKA